MGAPTALAAVTVSARRRGLPQHRGQTPEPAKRTLSWHSRTKIQAIPLAKIGCIRHGKRYGNHTVMTTADDLGERHSMAGGILHV